MQKKTLLEISEKYDLEIDRIVNTIKKEKSKKVLLQFPEGMKPYSTIICSEIERLAKVKCFIWLDSCFGACDIPTDVSGLGIDLIIQFGHSSWNYGKEKGVKVVKQWKSKNQE
jgi:2-(3-amino-3-carboxypropyl)histidine synthase